MKNKELIIATISFFLYVNTKYYWISKLGTFAHPTVLISGIILLGLIIALAIEVYFATKEKFSDRSRLFIVGLLSTVLVLTFYKPSGLFVFEP